MVKQLELAIAAAQQGNWRNCCNAYKAAFLESKQKGAISFNRTFLIFGACATLNDRSTPPTEADQSFLKAISKDESESVINRMLARQCRSYIFYDQSERDKAALQKRKVLELAAGVSDSESSVQLVFTHPTKHELGMYPSRLLIDHVANQERANLARMNNHTHVPISANPDPIGPIGTSSVHGVGFSGNLMKVSQENADALIPGGAQCDSPSCNTPPSESKTLLMCSRCKIWYYCSKSCQNEHWSAHKHFCPKKGHFLLTGDRVLIKGLVSKPELNSCVATVTGSLDGRWVCELANGQSVKIKDENLSRLRPRPH
jgi:hypothetical protein